MYDDNPYAAPEFSAPSDGKFLDQAFRSSDEGGCWRDGRLLVLRKEAILPDRCIKCNLPANQYRLTRKLSWHPPVWYLTLLISPLLYIIVGIFVRNSARIKVGLCPHHRTRRFHVIASAWAAILVGIALIMVGSAWAESDWFLLVFLVASIMILSGIIGGIVGSQVVSTKSIDKYHVWLAKVNPEYLEMLPAWLD